MFFIPLILVVLILLLLMFVGFWDAMILIVVGAGVFALIMFVLSKIFNRTPQ